MERVKSRFDQGSWFSSVAIRPEEIPKTKTKELLETNHCRLRRNNNENKAIVLNKKNKKRKSDVEEGCNNTENV